MNTCPLTFSGAQLVALPSGALHWPDQALLVVSDLHLGKAARVARWGGAQLPPYETRETLDKLATDLEVTAARHVVCLGDSFDAQGMDAELPQVDQDTLTRLQAGITWTWIEGNHDPGPVSLGGAHLAELRVGELVLRHIASGDVGEVSGHYHPKARLHVRGKLITRPCFLFDRTRLIMPAYGTYTGGLATNSQTLCTLMDPDAQAILIGPRPSRIPMPR